MKTTGFFLALSLAMAVAGCSVIADVHTYDAVHTTQHSNQPEGSVPAEWLDPGCRWPCYRIGASLISFYPASRGSNVKAMGPILPVIPAPGSGKDHGEFDFFLAVHVHPGKVSLVTFQPKDFRILPDGSDTAIEPDRVTDCESGEPSPDRVRVFGQVKCFKIEFPIRRAELHNFLMVPATVESDSVVYTFADLQWSPGSFRVAQ